MFNFGYTSKLTSQGKYALDLANRLRYSLETTSAAGMSSNLGMDEWQGWLTWYDNIVRLLTDQWLAL